MSKLPENPIRDSESLLDPSNQSPKSTPTEELALKLFAQKFGQPTHPLRERGGALDPRGWALQEAQRYKRQSGAADDQRNNNTLINPQEDNTNDPL